MSSFDNNAVLTSPKIDLAPKRVFVLALERPLFVGISRNFRDQGIDYKTCQSVDVVLKSLDANAQPEVLLIDMDSIALRPFEFSRVLEAACKCSVPIVLKGAWIPSAEDSDNENLIAKKLPSLAPFLSIVHTLHALAVSSRGRKDPRIKLDFPAKIAIENETKTARILDLSASGALVFGETFLQEGSQFNLSFELPRNKKELIANCVVARVVAQSSQNGPIGLGLKFIEFTGDSGLRIDRFVSRQLSRDAEQLFFRRQHVRSERK